MSHQVKFIHIICTDPRIQKIYHNYLRKNKLLGNYDTIQYENPILAFIGKEERGGIIERIKAYRELHGANTIVLFDHFDCGAYKLHGYQFNNFEDELRIHRQNNQQAVQVIKENFPDMNVEVKYIKINLEDKHKNFLEHLLGAFKIFLGFSYDDGHCEWWREKEKIEK